MFKCFAVCVFHLHHRTTVTVCNNRKLQTPESQKTDLLSDRLPWRQLRLDGDEQRDEGPLGLTAQGVVATVDAVAPLLPVAQQHRRRVHLERSVDLADRTGGGKVGVRMTRMVKGVGSHSPVWGCGSRLTLL